ncbi:MAG: hypothetical protein R3F10_01265 [Lysobacteraceae bacterium]
MSTIVSWRSCRWIRGSEIGASPRNGTLHALLHPIHSAMLRWPFLGDLMTTTASRRQMLLAIFVLSGFAGLIYQSIWSHYLGLFLGHAAYAQALVLALFMGGMAVGAAWIAKAGERWRNLIRGYALIELAIGVLGLLFHVIFTGVVGFSYDVLIPAVGSSGGIAALKWVLAAILILPQTILLGMTFPLMSGGLIRRYPQQDGSLLGGLYFTNSMGAAIGALASAFVLLPLFGLPGALVTAGVVNIVVAALAWWMAREPEPLPATESASQRGAGAEAGKGVLRLVLWGTALSGAASFVYEIVWIRMLGMAVGSTMHAFELMLAAFIAGIALGGLWIRKRADRTDDPLRLVGWMQIFMGLAALSSLVFYANAFEWVGWLMAALSHTEGGYVLFNLGTAGISLLIMMPAAFFAGTTLPLFTVTLLRSGFGGDPSGVCIGTPWESILGVSSGLHLLIPGLGLKLALCVGALVDMAIGLVLLRVRAASTRDMTRFCNGWRSRRRRVDGCGGRHQARSDEKMAAGVFHWICFRNPPRSFCSIRMARRQAFRHIEPWMEPSALPPTASPMLPCPGSQQPTRPPWCWLPHFPWRCTSNPIMWASLDSVPA